MAAIYARAIMAGLKTINDVPAKLKDQVLVILAKNGYVIEEEAEEEEE